MAKRVKKAEYYIELKDGTKVPVTEEVYYAYKTPAWKETKRAKKRAQTECSYDFLVEKELEGRADTLRKLTGGIAADREILELLRETLNKLDSSERDLISALYFENKSERQFSRETGVPRKTISYRKDKILRKLKKLLEEI